MEVDDLNFYMKETWDESNFVGKVEAGLGFTIDTKVDVKGSP